MLETARKKELYRLWCEETNEAETQEWRQDLTAEEDELVELWDGGYDCGLCAAAAALHLRKLIRRRYRRGEVEELTTVGSRCRLRLKTGELYMASLAESGELCLASVDEAC